MKVAVPVRVLYAVPVSDTARLSGTDWPEIMVSGEVVLNTEVVGVREPSSTVTLALLTFAVTRSEMPSPLKSTTAMESEPFLPLRTDCPGPP